MLQFLFFFLFTLLGPHAPSHATATHQSSSATSTPGGGRITNGPDGGSGGGGGGDPLCPVDQNCDPPPNGS